jgi:hypothetical protein
MARAHFVKAARKDYPEHGIKKGESYYWWAFMVGGRGGKKRYSKTAPTRSQLTQSEFYGRLYDIEDAVQALTVTDADTMKSECDDFAEQLRELGQEQRDKFDNMPEGLQQGDTGQRLEERADWCEERADEFEQIDFDDFDGEEDFDVEDAEAEAEEDDSNETDEDRTAAVEEARGKHDERQAELRKEWLEEKLTEIQNIDLSSPN